MNTSSLRTVTRRLTVLGNVIVVGRNLEARITFGAYHRGSFGDVVDEGLMGVHLVRQSLTGREKERLGKEGCVRELFAAL